MSGTFERLHPKSAELKKLVAELKTEYEMALDMLPDEGSFSKVLIEMISDSYGTVLHSLGVIEHNLKWLAAEESARGL